MTYERLWQIALEQMREGKRELFAALVQTQAPQPQEVADLLADLVMGKAKLPSKRRGPAPDIDDDELIRLQGRFVRLRLMGRKSEALAIDTLHNETGIPTTTLRKYLGSSLRRSTEAAARHVSRLRKKP